MKTIAYILTVSLLLLTQCRWFDDDDNPVDKLPAATQTGKNTFGCLINGQPWIADGGLTSSGITAQRPKENWLWIGGSNKNGQTLLIEIFDTLLVEANKSYYLNDTTQGFVRYVNYSNSNIPICFYEGGNTIDGNLIFTKLNLNERIVSGTFEFTTINPDCGDTIRVTEGRFDIPNLVL